MDSLLIIKLIRYLGLKVFLVLNNSYNLEIKDATTYLYKNAIFPEVK